MRLRAHFVLALALVAAGCQTAAGEQLRILNFDKIIMGSDKMVFVQPPPGKTWTIHQGSSELVAPIPGAAFVMFLEDAPFQVGPYRNPLTGEFNKDPCNRCVTLARLSTENQVIFPIVTGAPITVNWPNRLVIVVTPPHGGFPYPFQLWTRLQVKEEVTPVD